MGWALGLVHDRCRRYKNKMHYNPNLLKVPTLWLQNKEWYTAAHTFSTKLSIVFRNTSFCSSRSLIRDSITLSLTCKKYHITTTEALRVDRVSTISYGTCLLSQIKKGFMYKTVRLGKTYQIMVNTNSQWHYFQYD